jgi:hypothetical protein
MPETRSGGSRRSWDSSTPRSGVTNVADERAGPGSETLMVRCRSCARAFATPWQVDRASLEAMVVTEVYRCPWCGATHTYFKQDHTHQLVVGDDRERG